MQIKRWDISGENAWFVGVANCWNVSKATALSKNAFIIASIAFRYGDYGPKIAAIVIIEICDDEWTIANGLLRYLTYRKHRIAWQIQKNLGRKSSSHKTWSARLWRLFIAVLRGILTVKSTFEQMEKMLVFSEGATQTQDSDRASTRSHSLAFLFQDAASQASFPDRQNAAREVQQRESQTRDWILHLR